MGTSVIRSSARVMHPYLGNFAIGDAPSAKIPWWKGRVGIFKRVYRVPCECGSSRCTVFVASGHRFWASDGRKTYGPFLDAGCADMMLTLVLQKRGERNAAIKKYGLAVLLALVLLAYSICMLVMFTR